MSDCCHSEPVAAPPLKPAPSQPSHAERTGSYWPLLVIVISTALAALAMEFGRGNLHPMSWMNSFMGFFLMVFGMLKLFDLRGFAEGFSKYDLLAKRSNGYALAYPFVELGLGLAMFAHFAPLAVNVILLVVMTIGAIGVLRALSAGLDLRCACLGSSLNVPLSTVAVVEDLGMALMAALMILLH